MNVTEQSPVAELQVGAPGGDLMVLIGGMTRTDRPWTGVVNALPDNLIVISYDFRRSRANPITVAGFADELAAAVETIGRPAHVCGHSFGGLIAQELTLRHPHLVASLALVSTFAGIGDMASGPAASTESPSKGRGRWGVFFSQVASFAGFDSRARLPEVAAPIRVIHGTADSVIPFDLGQAIADLVDGGTVLEYDGAGHGLPSSHATQLAADLLAFIRDTNARPTAAEVSA